MQNLKLILLTWLYNFFIAAYSFFIQIASFRNEKAKQWLAGRKHLWKDLQEKLTPNEPLIWIHAASTGEFEQAKPVIEQLKIQYPAYKILVTFFSPSGYHAARTYTLADYKYYLPADTDKNAKRFIRAIRPKLVIFVKYEFWYHHLSAIHRQGVPLLLISSTFRKDQAFFQWYGTLYKRMLHFFTWIFVQDVNSLDLLRLHGINHCSISGDTRFDRVAAIEDNFTGIPLVEEFAGNSPILVAGSTWPGDEDVLASLQLPDLKYIIAPHELQEDHIDAIIRRFPNPVRYSMLKQDGPGIGEYQTLIIDNIGMLSRLYKYATITYVGGGFTKDGIHNTLEAAVFAKPVIIGPNYKKYREAKELVAAGGAFSIQDASELARTISGLLSEEAALQAASNAAGNYVQENKGATGRILQSIPSYLGKAAENNQHP